MQHQLFDGPEAGLEGRCRRFTKRARRPSKRSSRIGGRGPSDITSPHRRIMWTWRPKHPKKTMTPQRRELRAVWAPRSRELVDACTKLPQGRRDELPHGIRGEQPGGRDRPAPVLPARVGASRSLADVEHRPADHRPGIGVRPPAACCHEFGGGLRSWPASPPRRPASKSPDPLSETSVVIMRRCDSVNDDCAGSKAAPSAPSVSLASDRMRRHLLVAGSVAVVVGEPWTRIRRGSLRWDCALPRGSLLILQLVLAQHSPSGVEISGDAGDSPEEPLATWTGFMEELVGRKPNSSS